MIKLFIVGTVPEALAQKVLQHIRDFDTAHPGCHFEIAADAPEMSVAEMVEAVKVDPALSFEIILRQETKHDP